MTFGEKLLHKLPEWSPQSGQSPLRLSVGDWELQVKAGHVDVVGGQYQEIHLQRKQEVENLRGWAEGTAERVVGLMEALRLLEIDEPQQVALLRSDKPTEREDNVSYYEVRLTGKGSVSVQRWQASREGSEKRKQVPFTLTHEVVANLVDALIADA